MNKVTFEAYNLEELCNDFDINIGSQYYDYLIDSVLSCEMSNSAQGMEYSLIYLNNIIDAMDNRFSNYEEDELNDFKAEDLQILLSEFMQGKDEQTLVYIQGW